MGKINQEELVIFLTRAKQGNKIAFEKLYTELFLPVYRYIFKRVGNKTIAEDLTQTVFLKVYTSETEFQNKQISPLAYFFTIARTTLIDHFKKQPPTLELTEDTPIAPTNHFEKQFAQTESIQKALSFLEETQKQILTLKFFEGYTTSEIARRINMNEANVRQIQCRAIKKLRDYFSFLERTNT